MGCRGRDRLTCCRQIQAASRVARVLRFPSPNGIGAVPLPLENARRSSSGRSCPAAEGWGRPVPEAAPRPEVSFRSAVAPVHGGGAAERGGHHGKPRQPPRHRAAGSEELRSALPGPLAEEKRRHETNEQGG